MEIGRVKKILFRGLLLRCPDCGQSGIYQSLLQVKHHCTNCGLVFQREQGYFTGALYINIAAAEFAVLVTFLICLLIGVENADRLFTYVLIAGVATPAVFFFHSRSLWLAIDHLIDPIQDRVRLSFDGFESGMWD